MAIIYVVGEKINPRDIEAPRKWYGSAIHTEIVKFKQLAREVAAESTTASEGDTYAVMIGMVDKIRYHLGKSHKIVIDGLGTFFVNIRFCRTYDSVLSNLPPALVELTTRANRTYDRSEW